MQASYLVAPHSRPCIISSNSELPMLAATSEIRYLVNPASMKADISDLILSLRWGSLPDENYYVSEFLLNFTLEQCKPDLVFEKKEYPVNVKLKPIPMPAEYLNANCLVVFRLHLNPIMVICSMPRAIC